MWSERYTRKEQDRYRGRDTAAGRAGAAPRDRAEYGAGRPSWGSARSDYGRYAYGGRLDDEGMERRGRGREDRGFLERTGDEVRSWFGDEDAERRRRMDEQQDYSRGTERWTNARARDVMTLEVQSVRPDDSAEYAARLMRDCDCGALPVVDRERRLIGMITDRDLAVRLVARGANIRDARVDDCMTNDAFACQETTSIEDCMREMSRHQVRRMPIVDRGGQVVGIVSQSDLARHAEHNRGRGERRAVADVLCAISEPSAQPYR